VGQSSSRPDRWMQAFGWLTRDAVDPNMASGERTVSEDGGEDAIGWSEAAVRTNGLDDTAGVEVIEQGLMRLDVPHLPVESLDLDRSAPDEYSPGSLSIPVEPPGSHACVVESAHEREPGGRESPVKGDRAPEPSERCDER
jgi:hypothetical protein